ncbi:MAG: T9SS type B sorting domain-containing protein [Bacteroidales bacterium]|nr:T9SS type B sorting domain-containing protein [Bacteroidales bacterium]
MPREVWVAQGDERLGYLQYTGGDAGPKTATVTTLPSQGELWQVSGGMKSTRITSVPAIVTDPQYALIYVASGGTGNGAGSFNFRFTDGTGDSPEATITINVNPPGIPNLLNTARNEGVELRFDRVMNNPAGKESQFTVTVDGSPVAVTSAGLKTGDPYTITLTLASPLTGSENVSVSYTKGDVSAITGGLLESFTDQTVTLLAQTISFTTNLDKVYGNSPFSLSATSSSGLTTFTWSSSNLTVATISGSTVTILSAGISEISALQAGNAIYAPARYIRTLTVSKANQTITFNPLADKTYGDSPFSLTATASSGLPVSYSSDNPAVASVTGNTVTINGAGTAVITASQSGNSNWNPAPDVQRTLTVSRANQTITFDPLPAKTFGDAPFTISASATSGLAVSFTSDNPAVASVSGNTVTINGAGTANITASQAGNANYNAAPDVQQTLSVSKANQTIIFNPLPDKTYGDEPFALEAFVNSGLPVTYSSGNTQVATITGFTVTITGAGTSVITASQPGNANYYAADDVQQTLTVNKAPQVITVTRKPENLLVSDTFHLRALSTSGLEVQYESSNTAVVSVSGNVITGVSKGTVTVRALNSGNSNYLAAPDVTFTVTVTSSHPNILYLFTPNGDGFNDYWELPLNLWGRCEVKIYNRWGKLVYDNPDYNNLWDGTSDGNPVPEGAYYFVVKTESAGTVKGTVNIVR